MPDRIDIREGFAASRREKRDIPQLRILIVDPDSDFQEKLKGEFAGINPHLEVSESLEEAKKKLQKAKEKNTPFNIVFAEQNLPDGKGFDLSRAVLEGEGMGGSYVILMSSKPETLPPLEELARFGTLPFNKNGDMREAVQGAMGAYLLRKRT